MATIKQLEANRRNAQKSTGPRTDNGKALARLNALRHGLRAEKVPVLPHESAEAYRERVIAWLELYLPTDAAEEQLVRRAAQLTWKLDRADRHEAAYLSQRVRTALEECPVASEAERAQVAAMASFDPGPQGERLRRYQLAMSRELTRTLDTLARLRREKSNGTIEPYSTETSPEDEAPGSPDAETPNEANSTVDVQLLFGSEPIRADQPTGKPASTEATPARPLTQRDKAIARMIKKAEARR